MNLLLMGSFLFGNLSILPVALAEESSEESFVRHTAEAKSALMEKNFEAASGLLNQVYSEIESTKRLVTNKELAEIWYLRGMLAMMSAVDPSGDTQMEAWRRALVLNPDHSWDEKLSDNEEGQDTFWALKSEVKSRPIVSLQLPTQYGMANLYVDGFKRAPGEFSKATTFVYQGEHFAQFECPNDSDDTVQLVSKWVTFERKFDWLGMCPSTFDVTKMPVVEESEDDGFGDLFATGPQTPEVNLNNPALILPLWDRLNKNTLYAAGGTAVVATALYSVALSNRAAFMDVSNPDLQTLDDLDAFRKQTNIISRTSLGFGVVSGVLYLYAMQQAKPQLEY